MDRYGALSTLLEDVVKQDKWTIALIKQRTEKLSNEALELFKF